MRTPSEIFFEIVDKRVWETNKISAELVYSSLLIVLLPFVVIEEIIEAIYKRIIKR